MNIKTVYYQFREYNHSHIESLSQQKGESSSELELLLHEMKHKAKKQNKTTTTKKTPPPLPPTKKNRAETLWDKCLCELWGENKTRPVIFPIA